MSEKLLESDNLTFNLNLLGMTPAKTFADEASVETTVEETSGIIPEETENGTSAELEALPAKGEWGKWKDLLNKHIDDNNKLSASEKKTQYEVESEFFREFFTENWGHVIGEKLMLIGDPLTKAIKVLGFDPTKNPILGFIRQKRVVTNLIATEKLNVETFKAIYNAVANNFVAHSELIKEKPKNEEYNILYCLDLYNKPVKEMLDYLRLQSQILQVSASQYTAEDQLKNKRAFLFVSKDAEKNELPQEETKRAAKINELGHDQLPILTSATLNTIALARAISNNPITKLDNDGQDALVAKLSTPAKKCAALLALSLTTNNTKAKEALKDSFFTSLPSDKVFNEVNWLATNNIMPKGQLNKTDADFLVAKILASLHKES